jgi:phosphoribosylanthranilate isomerase
MGFIKLCGMVKPADVRAAQSAGADAIGLVIDFPPSVRSLDLETAAKLAGDSHLPVVALLVDPDESTVRSVVEAVHPWAIQLSGNETVDQVRALKPLAGAVELWKVLHVPAERRGAISSDDPANEVDGLESDSGSWSDGAFESTVDSGLDVDAFLALAEAYQTAGITRIVLDAQHEAVPGGTGLRLDWGRLIDLIGALRLPVILAGGLTPGNVADAIQLSGTAAVDVSSGIESAPGIKDPELMHLFVQSARSAFDD